MARSLHVRLDDAAITDLGIVRATEATDSDAVRTALHEAAAWRRSRAALQQEARLLAADPVDAEEMRDVLEHLAELAPDPSR